MPSDDKLRQVLKIAESAGVIAEGTPAEGTITNTSTISKPGASNFLACSLIGGNAIEAMEARGQQELASQISRLPARGIVEQPELWERMGIRVGSIDPEDNLFVEVTLPEGWRICRSDHSMWTHLVDNHGRERAHIFYKAAFYDRRANITAQPRFDLDVEYTPDFEVTASRGERQWRVLVKDNKWGVFVHFSSYVHLDDHKLQDTCRREAEEWLQENYPDHKDPVAYWRD